MAILRGGIVRRRGEKQTANATTKDMRQRQTRNTTNNRNAEHMNNPKRNDMEKMSLWNTRNNNMKKDKGVETEVHGKHDAGEDEDKSLRWRRRCMGGRSR